MLDQRLKTSSGKESEMDGWKESAQFVDPQIQEVGADIWVNLVLGSISGLGLAFVVWFHWFLVMGAVH